MARCGYAICHQDFSMKMFWGQFSSKWFERRNFRSVNNFTLNDLLEPLLIGLFLEPITKNLLVRLLILHQFKHWFSYKKVNCFWRSSLISVVDVASTWILLKTFPSLKFSSNFFTEPNTGVFSSIHINNSSIGLQLLLHIPYSYKRKISLNNNSITQGRKKYKSETVIRLSKL